MWGWSSHFFANLLSLNGKLWKLNVYLHLYLIGFNNQAHSTTAYSQNKADKNGLEPDALWASRQIQVGRNDVTFSGLAAEPCFKMEADGVEFGAFLESYFSG